MFVEYKLIPETWHSEDRSARFSLLCFTQDGNDRIVVYSRFDLKTKETTYLAKPVEYLLLELP